MNALWLIAIAGGALLLGLALAYAQMNNRRLTGAEKTAQDEKVRELYDREEPEEEGLSVLGRDRADASSEVVEVRPRAGRDAPSRHAPEPARRDAAPGTSEERPRWEGPPETRPRGYDPATDDPDRTPDAAGETNAEPSRENLGDVTKTRRSG
jgi:hypothetical protein